MIRQLTRSLSARLLGIFLVTSIIYGVASRYAVNLVLDRDYLRQIAGAHIALHTNYVMQDLGDPPSVERARAITEANPFDILIIGPDQRWASDPDFPSLDVVPFEQSEFIESLRSSDHEGHQWVKTLDQLGFARYDRHSYVRIDRGDYRIVFVSPKIATRPPPDLTWPTIGLISILVLGGCYVAVRWVVRPIGWIKEGADRIGRGDLGYRIPRVRNDDLGELTAEINHMADDVQRMLEAKQQMLLAISHELRSPLTRTRVALEMIDDDEARRHILEDVEEMEQLIHELLESERLNTRHSPVRRSHVDLAGLADKLAREDFAEVRGRLRLSLPPGGLPCDVDATRVRLLIKNLLENALRHSPTEAGPVELELRRDGSAVLIRVADHGSGMSPAEVERATEPFYRADPARCRHTGGFGLGLYLCRRIAEAHGGSLEIASREGEGTTVTVRLPVEPPVAAAA